MATETARMTATELVRRFQAEIWRYLRFLGCEDAQADDLTQETFLAVIRKPFEHRSDHETSAYLRKVARNQMLMIIRQSKRGPTVQDLELAENVWAESVVESSDDYLDALEDCLESVNGRARRAIELHYRNRASRLTIADKLDMKPDGVKTLLRRTRALLRQCIERKTKQ